LLYSCLPRLPACRLLVDTFAAGLVAFLLAIQWRWYISARRDVKVLKKHQLLGVLDRAVLREVDIAEFALLGRDKKPEAPKVCCPAAGGLAGRRGVEQHPTKKPNRTLLRRGADTALPFPSWPPLPVASMPRLCWTMRSGA
jgi:hypothetical protein